MKIKTTRELMENFRLLGLSSSCVPPPDCPGPDFSDTARLREFIEDVKLHGALEFIREAGLSIEIKRGRK